jgi:hypothetical protein
VLNNSLNTIINSMVGKKKWFVKKQKSYLEKLLDSYDLLHLKEEMV